MGLFPGFFKIPKSDIIPNIITLGGYALGKGSLQEGARALGPAIRSALSVVKTLNLQGNPPPQSVSNYGPGNAYQPYYGQQYPGYDNLQQFGSTPWDSSTISPASWDWRVDHRVVTYPQDSTSLDWGQGPFSL